MREGRNLVGRGGAVIIPYSRIDLLTDSPDAFLLDAVLRRAHEGQRETFAVSPKGMATGHVIGDWDARRYSRARDVLLRERVLVKIHDGGRGARDPHLYAFADRSPVTAKGADSAPNTNETPRPPVTAWQATLREAA